MIASFLMLALVSETFILDPKSALYSERFVVTQPATQISYEEDCGWTYGFENFQSDPCIFSADRLMSGIRISYQDGIHIADLFQIRSAPTMYVLTGYDGVFDFFGPSAARLPLTRFHQSHNITLPSPIQGNIRVDRFSYFDWSASTGNAGVFAQARIGGVLTFQ